MRRAPSRWDLHGMVGLPRRIPPQSSQLARRSKKAAIAGVTKFVDDEVSHMLSKLADCADLLAAIDVGATVADHDARAAQDRHQRLRLSNETVDDEMRTGLGAVAPALDFSRKEPVPCPSSRSPTGRG